MTAQKETAPAVQAEAVNGKDSAHVSANDDRQPAESWQAARSVHLANVPEELRRLPQWAVATGLPKVDDIDKAPRDPRTGRLASTADPSTWATFEECLASPYPLIGFMLSDADPFTIIDLDDKVANPASEDDKATFAKIIETFDSYTERSASGRGYHVVVRGKMPASVKQPRLEIYSARRFMIFTGDVCRPEPIQPRQELLDRLYAKSAKGQDALELASGEATMTDAELYAMASSAANADKFNLLWSGQIEDWSSQSEADLALVSMLCYYTRDNEQVERMFRNSALGKRDKAARKDYLPRTITQVRKSQPPTVQVDLAALYAQEPADAHDDDHKDMGGPLIYPPGLVGEVAEFIEANAPRPMRETALAGAIALVAGIAGRAYNISRPATGLQQYMIVVAPTGYGKEAARSSINDLLSRLRDGNGQFNAAVMNFRGPGRFASGQGMLAALSEWPCFVSMLGEFGHTLREICDPKNNSKAVTLIEQVLLNIYGLTGWNCDLDPTVHADASKNSKIIRAPNLTILGDTTPEVLFDQLNETHAASGLLPRITILEYKGPRPLKNRGAGVEPSASLLARLNDLVIIGANNCNQKGTQLPATPIEFDSTGKALLDGFDDECDGLMDDGTPIAKQLWARAHLKALKLAGLVAVGCNKDAPTVDAVIAAWAIDFVKREICSTVSRFDHGRVGAGEGRQEEAVRKLVNDFLKMKPAQRASMGIPKFLTGNAIPLRVFQLRLAPLKAFADHRAGGRKAVELCLASLVQQEVLQRIAPEQVKQEFGSATPAWIKGPAWRG